jgi:hypothetical protein
MSGKPIGQAALALGLLFGLAACNSKTEDGFKTQEGGKTVKEAHVHHDYGPGPHKGVMADLGSDHSMVVELVFSADPRSITAYVVGHDDQTKFVPLDAKSMTLELHGDASPITLSAEPQEGDAEGKASKFVVTGDAIPESIKDQEDIEGHVKVEVGGKTLEAEFHHEEEDHDEGK